MIFNTLHDGTVEAFIAHRISAIVDDASHSADAWRAQIKTTPKDEFDFAYLSPNDPALPLATLGTSNGKNLGLRLPRKREIDWRELEKPETMCRLLNACLQDLGIKYSLTLDEVCRALHG